MVHRLCPTFKILNMYYFIQINSLYGLMLSMNKTQHFSAVKWFVFPSVTSWQISHRGSYSITEEAIPHNVLCIKVLSARHYPQGNFHLLLLHVTSSAYSNFCSHFINCTTPPGSDSALNLHLCLMNMAYQTLWLLLKTASSLAACLMWTGIAW
jgi:hypothetical protein